MLSASHNPMPDNGIKFFARGGAKLDDAVEDAIEARLGEPWARPTGAGVGRVRDDAVAGRGLRRAPGRQPRQPGQPRRAQGRRRLRERRGVRRRPGGVRGAGRRGRPDPRRRPTASTSTTTAARPTSDSLRSAVVEHGADVGFALDGDADRCLAVDATGELVDGDQILAILALAAARGGPADGRHRGRHGDEQPRVPPRHARGRHHASSRPPSATATCWRRCRPAASRSAASSPAT